MVVSNPQPKEPKESAVELAIAALDGNPNPLDMDTRDIDPVPTSLDLDGCQQVKTCPIPRRRAPESCA